ncbi:MAG TPA: ROK family transcriptional regulator [Amycolatopsis sp.]|nr:ROK family transcriptional regulator [Amycolatopsis sp.]
MSATTTVDIRLANLLLILHELRERTTLSRSDLARATGLAVPTVHRLVSELTAAGLVLQDEPAADESRLGRPPAVYRFHGEAGILAGLDVGNQNTRVSLASLSGATLAARSLPTAEIENDLPGALSELVRSLLTEAGAGEGRLAGVGVGVAAAVDPATGTLRDPPRHRKWHGLALAAELTGRLDCGVTVCQDDHLAAVAEASAHGTVPGAGSVVVLAVGFGIGVGVALDSAPIAGLTGRFGRIAGWPVTAPRGVRLPGRTLGDCLGSPGLVTQYFSRGGTGAVDDGKSLFDAARSGDPVARTVVAWAAREIAGVARALHTIFDEEGFVLGGGLAEGFDVLERDLLRHTEEFGLVIRPSVLGDQAVLTGALLAANSSVEPWLQARLTH